VSQWEQDLLELGFRFAKAAHYQVRWAKGYMQARQAEEAAEVNQQQ
jgi:hypothetical protein